MSLFDALSGRVGHFNDIAVPVFNELFGRIKTLDENKMQLFTVALGISQQGIDLFFKPPHGPVIKDVKQYNQSDIRKLYSVFMIWVCYDFLNSGLIDENDLNLEMKKILGIEDDVFKDYLSRLQHGHESSLGLDKLWSEIVTIIRTMPNTQENSLIFSRDFSKICRSIYSQ